MIWLDTEAANEAGLPEAGRQRLTFGVAIYERYRDKDSETPVESDRIEFTGAEQFWDWVSRKVDAKSATWVMAHNWNYDAGILNTSNHLLTAGWELAKYINGKPPVIVKWRRDGCSLHLIDTLNYFAGSVVNLGKAVGMAKLEMPTADAAHEAWAAYAWRDVEIIRAAFLAFRVFVRENDLGVLQPTLASQSFNAYRHRFLAHRLLAHDHEKALLLERAAYHGGRTEAFWNGEVNETLYKLDINSEYPAIMAREKIGYHFEAYFPSYKKVWREFAREHDMAIVAECDLETDEPVYGVVRDNKLIFPVGRFTAALTTPEIDYAEEHEHILKIGAFSIYKRDVLFHDFVHYFYGLRLGYKKVVNTTLDYMAKIIMNSLYGKFAQNGRKWVENPDYEWPYPMEGWAQPDPTKEPVKLRNRMGKVQVLETEGESENSIPIISAEITSYARVWLWKLIKEAGTENVYYVDTDSLIVNGVGLARLNHFIDATTLGALKMEGQSTHSVFNAPKDYVFGSDTRIKGVRAKAEKLGPNTFKQDTFRSWDWNLKNGADGYIDVVPTVKNLRRENTKRITQGKNAWTKPITLNEI